MPFETISNILCEDSNANPVVCKIQVDEDEIIPRLDNKYRKKFGNAEGVDKMDILNEARQRDIAKFQQFDCGGKRQYNLGSTSLELGNIYGKDSEYICKQVSRPFRGLELTGNPRTFPFGQEGVICIDEDEIDKKDDTIKKLEKDLDKCKRSSVGAKCSDEEAGQICLNALKGEGGTKGAKSILREKLL